MGTLLGGFTSFVLTLFWGRPLIPEIDSFIFNIVQGKSTEWGTEPWDTYFKKYLFQLFRPPVILMLAIPGLINDPANDGTKFGDKKSVPHPARYSLRILFISSILFIAAMSFPTSQRMEIHCLYYSNFHITSCKWSNKHLSKMGVKRSQQGIDFYYWGKCYY